MITETNWLCLYIFEFENIIFGKRTTNIFNLIKK